jgi:hypothetical protein
MPDTKSELVLAMIASHDRSTSSAAACLEDGHTTFSEEASGLRFDEAHAPAS